MRAQLSLLRQDGTHSRGESLRELYQRVVLAEGKGPRQSDPTKQHQKLVGIAISQLEQFLGRTAYPSDLCDETLHGFLQWRLAQGRAPATANRDRRNLVLLWNLAWREGQLAELTRVQPLRDKKRARRCWTSEQFSAIVRQAGRISHAFIGGRPGPAWFQSVLMAAGDTGLRREALLSATHADLDATGVLAIDGYRQKHRQDQHFQLQPGTVAAIGRMGEPLLHEARIWPTGGRIGINRHTLAAVLTEVIAAAGLRTPSGEAERKRWRPFHAIRCYVATQITIHRGLAEARRVLGHSSDRVTDGYVDWFQVNRVNDLNYLPAPLADDASPAGFD